jgi:secreted Zn-dependent insulinase-like peptidase
VRVCARVLSLSAVAIAYARHSRIRVRAVTAHAGAGVSVELTPEGLSRKSEVLSAVLEFLDLLRGDRIPDYFYTEPVVLADIFFRFRETVPTSSQSR